MMNVNRLIGEVAARNGIRVEPGDPAFALVTLNQLVLEEAAGEIREQIRAGIAEFAEVVHKTEAQAGRLLAQQVKEAAVELRRELQRDVETARVGAAEIVSEVHRAHTTAALVRWGAAGVISASAMFVAGVWVGTHYLR